MKPTCVNHAERENIVFASCPVYIISIKFDILIWVKVKALIVLKTPRLLPVPLNNNNHRIITISVENKAKFVVTLELCWLSCVLRHKM